MTTRERIRELWEAGVGSDVEIARRVGTSRQRVGQVLGPKRDRDFNVIASCREIREELERPIVLTVESPLFEAGVGTHGIVGTYMRGCRCALCTEANRQWALESRRRFQEGRHKPPHGTESTYATYRCRCAPCRAAGAEKNRRDRRKARRTA